MGRISAWRKRRGCSPQKGELYENRGISFCGRENFEFDWRWTWFGSKRPGWYGTESGAAAPEARWRRGSRRERAREPTRKGLLYGLFWKIGLAERVRALDNESLTRQDGVWRCISAIVGGVVEWADGELAAGIAVLLRLLSRTATSLGWQRRYNRLGIIDCHIKFQKMTRNKHALSICNTRRKPAPSLRKQPAAWLQQNQVPDDAAMAFTTPPFPRLLTPVESNSRDSICILSMSPVKKVGESFFYF